MSGLAIQNCESGDPDTLCALPLSPTQKENVGKSPKWES